MKLSLASADEKVARDRVTHATWGAKLTEEQYHAREARLREHAWTKEGMETWLLRGDDGAVLSSCESFTCTSFREGAPGTTFAIASVFTEPTLRDKGYAVTLIDQLVATLATRPDAHATILFSDVGAAIYERSGFVAVNSRDRVIAPGAGDPAQAVDELFSDTDVGAHIPGAPDGERFVVWPSAAQIDWHLERERVYAEVLGRERPPFAGALAGDGVALWTADFKNNRLAVLVMDAERADELAALIRAARRVAASIGLADVRVWTDPRLATRWPAGLGREEERPGGLAMIRPIAPGVVPRDWRVIPRAIWV
jgi:hypothetical protein